MSEVETMYLLSEHGALINLMAATYIHVVQLTDSSWRVEAHFADGDSRVVAQFDNKAQAADFLVLLAKHLQEKTLLIWSPVSGATAQVESKSGMSKVEETKPEEPAVRGRRSGRAKADPEEVQG